VIAGVHVEHYVVRPRTVRRARRTSLFANGVEVGTVPRLAIGRSFGDRGVTVLHCSARWNVVGVAGGYVSVRDAKANVERVYPGLAPHWVRGKTSAAQARRFWRSLGPEWSSCSRAWYEIERMVGRRSVHLCEKCINVFHDALRNGAA